MWYNPDPNAVRIPPLISAYDPEIGPELPRYNAWAGRCSYLLQGGQTVTDVAVLYPIASLQAWFRFDAPETRGWNWGKFVAPGTDYLALGDTLTNRVHRDFTFLHPETLAGEQVGVVGNELVLKNKLSPSATGRSSCRAEK